MGKVDLKTQEDTLTYALGVSFADNFKSESIKLNPEVFAKAMTDMNEGKPTMTVEDANKYVQNYFRKKEEDKNKAVIEEGKKFLAENAKKEGVQTTSSGLQYKIIKAGTGEKPTAESKVTVHYEGTLIDGTVFDSSYKRNSPATFGVGQVIAGWTEALQLMKKGAIWELYIPQELAYGPRRAGKISPYSTLIFKVELIDVK